VIDLASPPTLPRTPKPNPAAARNRARPLPPPPPPPELELSSMSPKSESPSELELASHEDMEEKKWRKKEGKEKNKGETKWMLLAENRAAEIERLKAMFNESLMKGSSATSVPATKKREREEKEAEATKPEAKRPRFDSPVPTASSPVTAMSRPAPYGSYAGSGPQHNYYSYYSPTFTYASREYEDQQRQMQHEGVLCPQMHLNSPDSRFCKICAAPLR